MNLELGYRNQENKKNRIKSERKIKIQKIEKLEEDEEEKIPEWRRTALKAKAQQQENQNEQELPFMEVPAVTGTSAQEV